MGSRSPVRSVSPEGHYTSEFSRKHTNKSRERSDRALPCGAKTISEDDYFLKSAEFGRWLREEKRKYFDELTADKSRSYFRKFVKAWNRGKLRDELYNTLDPASVPSNMQTAYKWSFASNRTRVNAEEVRRVREAVGGDTYNSFAGPELPRTSSVSGPSRLQGPTFPSVSDLQMAREDAASYASIAQSAKRKREREENSERIEDMIGPKEVGREGLLEKKRLKREGDKSFREAKGDGGFEIADSVLMGEGGSFRERIAQRDAARARLEAKKREHQDSKLNERRERAEQIKERDRKTMEMFKQIAKERFG